MMSQGNGHTKIGGEADADRSGQAVIAEKRVSLTVEFKITFREITPRTLREAYAGGSDLEELVRDPAWLEDMGRQSRLLRALLRDEDALRGFITGAVVGEIASCEGRLLRKELGAGKEGEEEALWRVVESLGGEDAEFYRWAREGGKFREYLELIFYSTAVECVGVRIREVDERAGSEESDKNLM